MTSASALNQQVPAYFLQEASELLQQIDYELQTLRQGFGVQKMHSLMRAAHTLKGAAASVGLDAIKTTTHSLEDAFKALCAPDANLTPVVEGLIFEAYDCLQLLLSVQLTNSEIDESEVLDRMASVVTQLQENLGDQFGQDGYLPTSTDLGFDMTQSIFEMGVNQRLDELENALKKPDSESLKALLQSQADVFFGLAESLNLPGFGEIARATVTAVKNQPNQVVQIAKIALKDYRSAQTLVLQGDRNQGGTPSRTLQQFSKQNSSKRRSKKSNQHRQSKSFSTHQKPSKSWVNGLWTWLSQPIGQTKSLANNSSQLVKPESIESLALLENASRDQTVIVQTPDTIWDTPPLPDTVATDAKQLPSPAAQIQNDVSGSEPSLLSQQQAEQSEPIVPANELPQNTATLRVSINHLEQLNHTIGELLTQQSRQALCNEHMTAAMKTLLTCVSFQQQQLRKLQRQSAYASTALQTLQLKPAEQQFDALELDHYSEQQLLVQATLDTMVQQMESAEAMELFIQQNNQSLEKQQRLVNDLRETILEARMQPLGNVLHRFHQVLARLTTQHSKLVTLKIEGEDVLVDKAIVDKLYDPLLHLVRNAFDHGIESPEMRQQQGKPETGEIKLSVKQIGRNLVIKIQDDGQGLNLDAIRHKAIDNQLITDIEAQHLTATQISDLIFEPDLSTASHINDLSGRGVGLDVVRTQIQTLRGTVTVTHQHGQGTCFTIKIPANLTIAKLLLCRARERLYALMTDTIEQILIPRAEQLKTRNNRKVLSLQIEEKDQLILVVPLSEALTYNGLLPIPQQPDINKTSGILPVILIRYKNRLVGLEIDHLIGEQELVIRSLGTLATMPSYIYGCSILPDGHLSLVIDGSTLILKVLQNFSQHAIKTGNSKGEQIAPRKSHVTKQTILIIDDSITVRNTLTKALQNAGYWVLQAKEGNEALQKLQHTDVAAILCDLEMPGMNGFEFLKARQHTPKIASVPTIMLTSRTGMKHRQLAQELGATGYLTKPYITPQLLTTLTNVLEQQLEKNYG
ncbi:hybrid sensor histidine kinase/response regulator [Adonisia turfae]|uniref:histidine kinase n=1 Tax=Adonisia turfae CCMR0081 TaxID=2292702 RepID=A0A6M0RW54_9CYAN|nr:hybrid sensor histidine kinase/response regulator [Adonisia turfae]NEZ60090.1 hybrid sensor histidine kinase/response regulator [Adonisia turfae CCMR0081]